jgi:hypothetical protein
MIKILVFTVATFALWNSVAKVGSAQSPNFTLDHEVTVSFELDAASGGATRWESGVILSVEKRGTSTPIIHVIDSNGVDSPVAFTIAGANSVQVEYLSQAADGSTGVTGYASDSDGHGSGFYSWISGDRQQTTTIRTSDGFGFVPRLMSMPSDGAIWIAGYQKGDIQGYTQDMNSPLIRRSDRNGKLMNSFLSFKGSHIPRRTTGAVGFMTSSATKIGWEMTGTPYYEFSTDGTTVTKSPAVPLDKYEMLVGVSMTDNGNVYSSTCVWGGESPQVCHLYILDRVANNWSAVGLPTALGPPTTYLLGGSGSILAFRTSDPALIRFFKVN